MARTRARSCTGKKRHTKEEAWDHLFSLKRKGDVGLHIYKCKFCKHYHVGHQGKRQRR